MPPSTTQPLGCDSERSAEERGTCNRTSIAVRPRLSVECAIEMGRRLAPYRPAWYEEPVSPWSLDLLKEVKQQLPIPIAAGERDTSSLMNS